MDGATDRTDGGTDDEDAAEPEDAVLFDGVVVRYDTGNDRYTLVPSEETLDAWLTADVEAVVDLDDWR